MTRGDCPLVRLLAVSSGRTRYAHNIFFFYLCTNYSTESRQEKVEGNTARRGVSPSCCVSIYVDTMRRGAPLLVAFLFTPTRREGGSPFLSCFYSHGRNEEGGTPSRRISSIHTDTTRGGISLLVVFLFAQTRHIYTR